MHALISSLRLPATRNCLLLALACAALMHARSARRLLLLFYPNSRRIATARLAAPQQA